MERERGDIGRRYGGQRNIERKERREIVKDESREM